MDKIDISILKQNLKAITNSYEIFNIRTLFPNILFINLVDQTLIANFSTQMANVKSSSDLQKLMSAVFDCSQESASRVANDNQITSFSSTGMFKYIFNTQSGATSSVIPFFIDSFGKSQLPSVSRIDLFEQSDIQAPSIYKTNLMAVLQNIFTNILQYIQSTLNNSQSSDFSSTSISNAMAASYSQSLVSYIESNVYNYILSDTSDINSYINNLYDSAYTYSKNMSGYKTSHFNLFFIVFLPYFYFLFIYNILPTAKIVSTNHGSRDGIVRRWTILSFYKFFMYMFYSIYKVSALYDPGSQYTYQLRLILDQNITSLFDVDANNTISNDMLDSLNDSTKTNMQNIASLQGANTKIEMNRSNLNNILNYQKKATADLASSKIVMWVWFSLLVVYVLTIPVFYFIPVLQNNIQYFFIVSLVFAIILIIMGMVAVVKNF